MTSVLAFCPCLLNLKKYAAAALNLIAGIILLVLTLYTEELLFFVPLFTGATLIMAGLCELDPKIRITPNLRLCFYALIAAQILLFWYLPTTASINIEHTWCFGPWFIGFILSIGMYGLIFERTTRQPQKRTDQ